MGKGGDFERQVSKDLTIWLTGKKKPYKFWRMPGSGGLATIHEENVDLSGDVRSLDSEGEFFTQIWSVECKNGYPKTSFWQHFKNAKTFSIKLFWIQCCNDADKSGKHPMLVYRKKGRQPIVGISLNDVLIIDRIIDISHMSSISLNWGSELSSVVFFDYKDFFEKIKPDDMKEIFMVIIYQHLCLIK